MHRFENQYTTAYNILQGKDAIYILMVAAGFDSHGQYGQGSRKPAVSEILARIPVLYLFTEAAQWQKHQSSQGNK